MTVQMVRFIRLNGDNVVVETNGVTDLEAFLVMQAQTPGYVVVTVGMPYPALGDVIPAQKKVQKSDAQEEP